MKSNLHLMTKTNITIGIVTTWFHRGAAYVSRAYKEVLDKSHRVLIYARGGEEYGKGDPMWDSEGVTWAPRLGGRAKARSSFVEVSRTHFTNWLTSNNIDIVLFNEERDIRLVELVKQLGRQTAAYVDYYTRESVHEFAIYDMLLCNTKRHYSVFDWHRNVLHIPWGCDTQIFLPGTQKNRREHTFFHNCGYAPHRKGTDLLLTAFSRMKCKATLCIHTQTSLEQYLSKVPIECQSRIDIREGSHPPPGLYMLGDVYVYPSRLEGIGLTVCEALSCGLPVIVTDEPPMNEFVKEALFGRLIPVAARNERGDGYYWPEVEADVDALTAILEEYARGDINIEEQQRLARLEACANRDWACNADCLRGAFEDLFRGNRQRRPTALEHLKWAAYDAQAYVRKAAKQSVNALVSPHS